MANFASVTLIGHLGRDVELKSLADGTSVANFSLATSRKRRDSETSTHPLLAWRGRPRAGRAELSSDNSAH